MTWKILATAFTAGILLLTIIYYFFNGTPVHDVFFRENMTTVTKIVDGDTIDVLDFGRIRLLGIDYPDVTKNKIAKWENMGISTQQIMNCYSRGIKELTDLIKGQNVTLEIDPNEQDKDQYGRLLRYVKLSTGMYVEEWLLERGYAIMYDPTDPLCAKCKNFLHIEQRVREKKIGCLWSTPFERQLN